MSDIEDLKHGSREKARHKRSTYHLVDGYTLEDSEKNFRKTVAEDEGCENPERDCETPRGSK